MKELIKNIFSSPKSTAKGASILSTVLSIWIAPEYTLEIVTALGTIFGTLELIKKDMK